MNPFPHIRPFGNKLSDLAVIAQLDGVVLVAVPHSDYRPRTATAPAWGGFDLWFKDSQGSIDSISPRSTFTADQMLLVMNMVRTCEVDLPDVKALRAYLKCAVRDAQRYAHRLMPDFQPAEYRHAALAPTGAKA